MFGSSAPASAQTRVLVVPLGDPQAFTPTARVADAIVRALRRKGRVKSKLGYPLPPETALPADPVQAQRELDAAKAAFQALEFDAVREHASSALNLFKAQIESGGQAEGYVDTLHLLAAAELFDNKSEAATNAMSDAVVFSKRAPSARIFNPSVQQLHAEVLAETERGELALRVSPGALIWLNGRLSGFAGGRLRLRAGLHWVRVFRPGYAPWLEWVRIHRGQTQVVATELRPLDTGESPSIVGLRRASTAPTPSPLVARVAREEGASEIILVSARTPCLSRRCTVVLNWAADGRWQRHGEAAYSGNPRASAAELLGQRTLTSSAGAMGQPLVAPASCRIDSDCLHGQTCAGGQCVKPDPVTQKWWFWTIIGAVAAGVAAGVAVPLTLADRPVIEVQ